MEDGVGGNSERGLNWGGGGSFGNLSKNSLGIGAG